MSKLQKLYDTIDNLRELQLPVDDNLQQAMEQLETKIIQSEVIPSLQASMQPIIRQIRSKVVLVVDWDPESAELTISKTRRGHVIRAEEGIVLYHSANNNYHSPASVDTNKPQRKVTNPITSLRVTLPNGKVIEDKMALNVFIRTLEWFGLPNVEQLGIMLAGQPLVGKKRAKYAQKVTPNGFYISVNSSTIQKQRLLLTIAKRLGKTIQVDILSRSDIG